MPADIASATLRIDRSRVASKVFAGPNQLLKSPAPFVKTAAGKR